MKTTLVILAAGIGSRFQRGIKALAKVGCCNEIIMDYSIHDAIKAGFSEIAFILRRDMADLFREDVGKRIEKICAELNVGVEYIYQDKNDLPEGFSVPDGREKPWGTGHALYACRNRINNPFAVINADDYYGHDAFNEIYGYLVNCGEDRPYDLSFVGYILKNTLSDSGTVNRGICRVDSSDRLISLEETKGIERRNGVIRANGKELDPDSIVSMNLWGFTPQFIGLLESGFEDFLRSPDTDITKDEFILPVYINNLLAKGIVTVKMFRTADRWFGLTYSSDISTVKKEFLRLVEEGVYRENLFDDILCEHEGM